MKIRLTSALLFVLLAGCGRAPLPAEIEAVAMDASQRGDEAAEQYLHAWAADGLPVAERELALPYRKRHRDDQARALFLRAARQGDAEAAYALGELERDRSGANARAAQWYRQAARQGHAQAALLLKNGDGIPTDKAAAAHWLGVAAQAGDAHAMFLLSNAYADGDGVPPDPRRARAAGTRRRPRISGRDPGAGARQADGRRPHAEGCRRGGPAAERRRGTPAQQRAPFLKHPDSGELVTLTSILPCDRHSPKNGKLWQLSFTEVSNARG